MASSSANHTQLVHATLRHCAGRSDIIIWNHPTGFDPVRKIHYGLNGSSDMIGCRAILITPDMVGETIGQFIGPEVKTGKGVRTKRQLAFARAIERLGGLCPLIRSEEDLECL